MVMRLSWCDTRGENQLIHCCCVGSSGKPHTCISRRTAVHSGSAATTAAIHTKRSHHFRERKNEER